MVICTVSNIDVHISQAVCFRFFDKSETRSFSITLGESTQIIDGNNCVDEHWKWHSEDDLHCCARACALGLDVSFIRHITRVENISSFFSIEVASCSSFPDVRGAASFWIVDQIECFMIGIYRWCSVLDRGESIRRILHQICRLVNPHLAYLERVRRPRFCPLDYDAL